MPIQLDPVSRRRFLAGGAVALSGLAAGGRIQAADGSADPHLWALLADSHIAPPEAFQNKDRKVIERSKRLIPNLKAVCRDVVAIKPKPAGLLVNGDCVEYGTPKDYETFLGALADLGRANVPVRLTLGNHDHRPHFLEAAPRSLHFDAECKVADRFVTVIPAERANWFLLDSLTMEDSGLGTIGRAQLAWLAAELDKHADKPALVMAHHNVNPGPDRRKGTETILRSTTPYHPLEGGLVDTDEFMDVLFQRRHVKACFCGHKHQLRIHRINGVYFVFQPAVGFPFVEGEPTGWLRLRLLDGGAELQMRSLDLEHRRHLAQVDLKWA